MIQIDKTLIDELFSKAQGSDRKRMNYDLRTSAEDKKALLHSLGLSFDKLRTGCICKQMIFLVSELPDKIPYLHLHLPSSGKRMKQ